MSKFQNLITRERARQDAKWGPQNHTDGTGSEGYILHAAAMKQINGDSAPSWAFILEEEVFEALAETDTENLKSELVQVAAVCQAWFEAIERRS